VRLYEGQDGAAVAISALGGDATTMTFGEAEHRVNRGGDLKIIAAILEVGL